MMTSAMQIKPDYKAGLVAKISETNLGHADIKGKKVLLTLELDAQF